MLMLYYYSYFIILSGSYRYVRACIFMMLKSLGRCYSNLSHGLVYIESSATINSIQK